MCQLGERAGGLQGVPCAICPDGQMLGRLCTRFRKGMEAVDGVRKEEEEEFGGCYTLATFALTELSLHWFD